MLFVKFQPLLAGEWLMFGTPYTSYTQAMLDADRLERIYGETRVKVTDEWGFRIKKGSWKE